MNSGETSGETAIAIVTGAAGFIGSHLCAALLRQGRSVVGVDNFDPFYSRAAKLDNIQRIIQPHAEAVAERHAGAESPTIETIDARRILGASPSVGVPRERRPRFTLIEADILDAARLRQIFAHHLGASIFHIAALAGVRPSIASPARYAAVNVDGVVSALEAARFAGCRTFVFASSSSVYGNNAKAPFAETDPVTEPISPYAATKRAGELLCHTWAHLCGMRIAALRLFTVFGPAQRPDLAIARFMRLIAAGEEVPMFGDGATARDYTYIDDVVQGILAAERVCLERGDTQRRRDEGYATPHSASPSLRLSVPSFPTGFFRIWNLGGAHPIALRDMIDAIAGIVGRPARIRQLPMQPGDVERTFADLSRSTAELGFKPRTTFEQGLRRQWEWVRESLAQPGVPQGHAVPTTTA